MSSCRCIIQSGKNAGKVCGKPIKKGKLVTCGVHAKTCHSSLTKGPKMFEESKSPIEKKVVERKVVLLINKIIVDEFPAKITFGEMKKRLGGQIDIDPYKDHIRDMRGRVAKVFETCDILRDDAGRIMPRRDLVG